MNYQKFRKRQLHCSADMPNGLYTRLGEMAGPLSDTTFLVTLLRYGSTFDEQIIDLELAEWYASIDCK